MSYGIIFKKRKLWTTSILHNSYLCDVGGNGGGG